MSDELNSDDENNDRTPSDNESTDDSRIEEFLQRVEGTETDQSAVDASNSSLDDPTADESDTGGRLWDSFTADRGVERTREQSPNRPNNGFSGDETTGRTETPADGAASANTRSDPHRPTKGDGADSGPNADAEDEPDSSSFKTILKRISRRISRTDSTGSTETTTDSKSTESAPSDTASVDHGSSGTAPNTETPLGPDLLETASNADSSNTASDSNQPAGSPTQSPPSQDDTIDQILNNIDVYGRATSSSQVLLLSPTTHSITNEIYERFLLPTDGSGQNVLFVSATQTVDDQLAVVRNIPNWMEGQTAVIEVGQSGLKPTGPNTGPDLTHQLDIYKGISNFQHLAKLGINISHIVSQWTDNRRPTVVGVHTLSSIQQYVGNETMFQFLFTLKGQLNSMGVVGFYHMDLTVHTDNEINTIKSAFDLVVTVSSDGTVDVE